MPTEIKDDAQHRLTRPLTELRVEDQTRTENTLERGNDSDAKLLANLATQQTQQLLDEWRFDLANGTHPPNELDAYFAGRIDQHNANLVAIAAAHPQLRESLPEALDFSVVKQQLQRENSEAQQVAASIAGYGF